METDLIMYLCIKAENDIVCLICVFCWVLTMQGKVRTELNESLGIYFSFLKKFVYSYTMVDIKDVISSSCVRLISDVK